MAAFTRAVTFLVDDPSDSATRDAVALLLRVAKSRTPRQSADEALAESSLSSVALSGGCENPCTGICVSSVALTQTARSPLRSSLLIMRSGIWHACGNDECARSDAAAAVLADPASGAAWQCMEALLHGDSRATTRDAKALLWSLSGDSPLSATARCHAALCRTGTEFDNAARATGPGMRLSVKTSTLPADVRCDGGACGCVGASTIAEQLQAAGTVLLHEPARIAVPVGISAAQRDACVATLFATPDAVGGTLAHVDLRWKDLGLRVARLTPANGDLDGERRDSRTDAFPTGSELQCTACLRPVQCRRIAAATGIPCGDPHAIDRCLLYLIPCGAGCGAVWCSVECMAYDALYNRHAAECGVARGNRSDGVITPWDVHAVLLPSEVRLALRLLRREQDEQLMRLYDGSSGAAADVKNDAGCRLLLPITSLRNGATGVTKSGAQTDIQIPVPLVSHGDIEGHFEETSRRLTVVARLALPLLAALGLNSLTRHALSHAVRVNPTVDAHCTVQPVESTCQSGAALLTVTNLRRALILLSTNAHAITDVVLARGELLEVTHGLALFGAGALLNHSCAPNAFPRFDGATLVIVSRRSLHPGEDVTINYGASPLRVPYVSLRRSALRERYGFDCRCIACMAPQRRVADKLTSAMRRAVECDAAAQVAAASGRWREAADATARAIVELEEAAAAASGTPDVSFIEVALERVKLSRLQSRAGDTVGSAREIQRALPTLRAILGKPWCARVLGDGGSETQCDGGASPLPHAHRM